MRYLPLALVFFIIALTGCPAPSTRPTGNGGTNGASGANTSAAADDGSPLAVTDGAGKTVLTVTRDGDKYTVTGASVSGSLRVKDGKLVIEDAGGKKIGSVKKQDDGDLALDDAAGKRLIKVGPKDGGYRVKDPAGTMLLKIKPKDNGFKVSDGNGKAIAKGKNKGNKLVFSSESGQLLYTVTGSPRSDVTGVLFAKQLTPLQQAAFIIAAKTL